MKIKGHGFHFRNLLLNLHNLNSYKKHFAKKVINITLKLDDFAQ